MKFRVGSPLINPHSPDTYEVVIKTMSGDADAYGEVIIGPFVPGDHDEALASLIETLDRMKDAYPNGRGGDTSRYNYNNVEGFYSWFGEYSVRDEEEYARYYDDSTVPFQDFKRHRAFEELIRSDDYFDWPNDVTIPDEGLHQDMTSYKVVYYDKTIQPFAVAIER